MPSGAVLSSATWLLPCERVAGRLNFLHSAHGSPCSVLLPFQEAPWEGVLGGECCSAAPGAECWGSCWCAEVTLCSGCCWLQGGELWVCTALAAWR